MSTNFFQPTVDFIKTLFRDKTFIPLHEPIFNANEKRYVLNAIESTYVSSVGEYVNQFEKMMAEIAGTQYAIAIVNGTAALHMSLILAGVKTGDEVISQALTFVATANAISYQGASPVFIDVDNNTMGMSANNLELFLESNALKTSEGTYNKKTNKRIAACVPMHTFGMPCEIDKIAEICLQWNIPLIEDAAEAIGSRYRNQPVGSFGKMGVFSFNGNKIVTSGGGGAIVTNDSNIAKLGKHLTTQAKVPHRWAFNHDYVGYNYRLPNINAALACAQLEQLDFFIANKRELANLYSNFFKNTPFRFIHEPVHSHSNYWLCSILTANEEDRDAFLQFTNDQGVMTRPIWTLMHNLPMFSSSIHDGLQNSQNIANRLVNIPSSVRI